MGQGEGGEKGSITNGQEEIFQHDRFVHDLDCGDGFISDIFVT